MIKKAEERLEWLNADEYSRMLYEARENALIEYNSAMRDAREEGREQGREQGREEGRESGIAQNREDTARKLLRLGMDHEQIGRITELSESEIGELAKENEDNAR